MEVHAHSHSEVSGHRKKWTHYFWEFLMLFLAVFCGFLAENLREHTIEHKRAKQFAVSLVNDLKEDTSALKAIIDFGNQKVKQIDSLLIQLELSKEKWNDTSIYKYEGIAGRIRPFVHNSGTYEQMRSSGSLRYFKQELTDLLNQYDVQANKTKVREDIHLNYAANMLNPFILHVLDARSLIHIQDGTALTNPLSIRKTDKETIMLWINYATVTQSTQQRTVVEYNAMLTMAKHIITELKEEYYLE